MLDIADNDRPMDARAASAHLDELGYPTAEATLAKYRTIGGGPAFIRFGRRIRYRPSALAAWLAQRARELRKTSEAA
jgi:hypothetical protein